MILTTCAVVASCREDSSPPSASLQQPVDAYLADAHLADAHLADASGAGAAGDAGLTVADADGGASQPEIAHAARALVRRETSRRTCDLRRGPNYIADADRNASYVDARAQGLFAWVSRSPLATLAADFAPDDLVDLTTGAPRDAKSCEKWVCLTRDAAAALSELRAAMAKAGFVASVESAYRSYDTQCATFSRWAAKGSFCAATEQSALPGHSQHQLGTALDLFTEAWRKEGDGEVFRNGFGCTQAGEFLRTEAWRYGFVLPYPIHPSDQAPKHSCEPRATGAPVGIHPVTGYRAEAWHLRFVGKLLARRLHEEAQYDPSFTLETWHRAQLGRDRYGAADLPVCDGCNCGACAVTEAMGDQRSSNACGDRALVFGSDGTPRVSADPPTIKGVRWRKGGKSWRLEVSVQVPPRTLTQPPSTWGDVVYEKGVDYKSVGGKGFPSLSDAWRLAVSLVEGDGYPYRFALNRTPAARLYDKVNALLPAEPGVHTYVLDVPGLSVDAAQTGAPHRVALVAQLGVQLGVQRAGPTDEKLVAVTPLPPVTTATPAAK
jgi:D-alanyl-D-alanine carboxypeptidase